MKTLHVIPDAGPSGITRELDILLTVQQDRRSLECSDLSPLFGDRSRSQPIDLQKAATSRRTPKPNSDFLVHCLNWHRWLDLRPVWDLRSAIQGFQPDCICAWGMTALRAIRLAAPKTTARILVRKPRLHSLSRFDRWLLQRADCILASNSAEAARCEAADICATKVKIVPPGVMRSGDKSHGSKSANPRILCAGELQPHKGFYEAIWTFDILHFANPNIELIIAGEGPERRRLEKFAHSTALQNHIHLRGPFTDIAPLLAEASLVWVPSLTDTGAGVALEAMAAGLPVIASRVPALADIVIDGETGFLVNPGGKLELARRTMDLLANAALRKEMGDAGQERVKTLHSASSFIARWQQACGAKAA